MAATIKSQIKARIIPKLEGIVAEIYAKEMWGLGMRLDDILEDIDNIITSPSKVLKGVSKEGDTGIIEIE